MPYKMIYRNQLNRRKQHTQEAQTTSGIVQVKSKLEFAVEERAKSTGKTLLWPAIGPITFRFGEEYDEPRQWGKYHNGIDIYLPVGSILRAAAKGVIAEIGFQLGGYGNFIIIAHGQGLSTRYAHISQSHVQPGQSARCGDVIGLSGATGWATGPHLHFEAALDGIRIDPEPLLQYSCSETDWTPPVPITPPIYSFPGIPLPVPVELSCTAGALNIRSGPGINFPVVGTLNYNATVSAVAVNSPDEVWVEHAPGRWSAALYHGEQYLEAKK